MAVDMIKTIGRDGTIEAIKNSEKPCRYTYGYKWRNPTTCEETVSKEMAEKIIRNESWVDVVERDTYFDVNAYSDNDMW